MNLSSVTGGNCSISGHGPTNSILNLPPTGTPALFRASFKLAPRLRCSEDEIILNAVPGSNLRSPAAIESTIMSGV